MLGNAVKIFWFKIILPKVKENVEESRFCLWIRFRKFDEYTLEYRPILGTLMVRVQ